MQVVRTYSMRATLAWVLALLCLVPAGLVAETAHVVSSSELQLQAAKGSQQRQENIAHVRTFLSSPAGRDALTKAHLDPQKIQTAVPELNDQELAQLSARADQAQKDFAAGYLSTRDIALVILGVALLILIIVIVR
jgi:hypothetical protein